MPIHNFRLKPSVTILGIVLPIGFMMAAAITAKAWIIWLAGIYVAVMLCFISMIKLREADGQEKCERQHAGQCVHCGYDLRGNQSGTCPECGARIVEPAEHPDSRR